MPRKQHKPEEIIAKLRQVQRISEPRRRDLARMVGAYACAGRTLKRFDELISRVSLVSKFDYGLA
jgi:hypothetical protein